jgi:hypothetical protein
MPPQTPPTPSTTGQDPIAAYERHRRFEHLEVLLVLAAVLTGLVLVFLKSDSSVPGDFLYRFDRGMEHARLVITRTPSERVILLGRQVQERGAEAESLIGRGRAEDIRIALAEGQTAHTTASYQMVFIEPPFTDKEVQAIRAYFAGQNALFVATALSREPAGSAITAAEITPSSYVVFVTVTYGDTVGPLAYFTDDVDLIARDIAYRFSVPLDLVKSLLTKASPAGA